MRLAALALLLAACSTPVVVPVDAYSPPSDAYVAPDAAVLPSCETGRPLCPDHYTGWCVNATAPREWRYVEGDPVPCRGPGFSLDCNGTDVRCPDSAPIPFCLADQTAAPYCPR